MAGAHGHAGAPGSSPWEGLAHRTAGKEAKTEAMAMRWFDWIRPEHCEIPGCSEPPVRRTFLLGAAQAWLCQRHCETLETAPLERKKKR